MPRPAHAWDAHYFPTTQPPGDPDDVRRPEALARTLAWWQPSTCMGGPGCEKSDWARGHGAARRSLRMLYALLRAPLGGRAPYRVRASSRRSSRAAATTCSSAGVTSAHARVLSPQSGLTHTFSAGKTCSVARSAATISCWLGTRGEWMS